MMKIMRALSVMFLYFCVATILAQAAGLVVLWQKGWLREDRLHKVFSSLYDIPSGVTQVSAANSTPKVDELPSIDDVLKQRALKSLEIDLRESAIVNSTAELRNLETRLKTDRDRFDQLQQSFEKRLAELSTSARDSAILETQRTLEGMSPKQAKDQLLRMLAELPALPKKETDRQAPLYKVVGIIKALPQDRRKKILAEFKTETESKQLAEILKAISDGSPDLPLLEKVGEDLKRVKPQDKRP